MTDKGLVTPAESTESAGTGQDGRPLQVHMPDPVTKQEIRHAVLSFGFPKVGTGVRLVLLTFARSPEVRAAVKAALHLATLTPAEDR